jgi:predicted Zn-dependent protease
LLVGSATLVAVLGVAGYLWYGRQASQLHKALEARALALEADGQWLPAAAYWQRYLWLKPDDFAARLKLIADRQANLDAGREVRLAAGHPESYALGERLFLSKVLRETIGAAGDAHPEDVPRLRAQLARNLLEMGEFSAAWDEANKLLDPKSELAVSPTSPEAVQMRRVQAVAGATMARRESIVALDDPRLAGRTSDVAERRREAFDLVKFDPHSAAAAIDASLKEVSNDLVLSTTAAEFYRQFADLLVGDQAATIARADRIMNDIVAALPNDPAAWMARFGYRVRHGLATAAEASDDLATALKLDPGNYNGLVLMAYAVASSDPAAARDYLTTATQARPTDNRAYLELAKLDLQQGDAAAAIATLTKARAAVGDHDHAIGVMLVGLLVEAGQLDEARTAYAQLDAAMRERMAQLSLDSQGVVADQMNLLRAQIEIAAGRPRAAAAALRTVIARGSKGGGGQVTRESIEARRQLAAVAEQLGYWDLAATYWGDLTARPTPPGKDATDREQEAYRRAVQSARDASVRAAAACLALQQYGPAIRFLEPLFAEADAPAADRSRTESAAWMLLTQAYLQQQLALPVDNRNWSKFDAALANARRLNPSRWELPIVEFERQFAAPDDEAAARAEQALAAGEQDFGDSVEFWRSAALGYQRLGQAEASRRALDKFDALEPDAARRAQLHAVHAARGGDFDEAQRQLTAALPQVDRQGKIALRCLQVELRLEAGADELAMGLAEKLVEAAKDEPRVLILGIETALRTRRYELAEQWERLLAALDPADDFRPRWYQARRLVDQYVKLSPAQRDELDNLLTSLRNLRPNSPDLIALSAQLEDARNNRTQAIDQYKRAIALGVRNAALMDRLITLLLVEDRSAEADQYFALLPANATVSAGLESLRIADALRRNEADVAVQLARTGVAKRPDDPVQRLLLAGALSRTSDQAGTEQVLRDAFAQFPEDLRVWNALFIYLQRTNQLEEAKKLLADLVERAGSGDWQRHMIAAQAYQAIGDAAGALAQAEIAVKIDPAKITGRMLLAKLLMTTDAARARREWEEIVRLDGTNREARRALALLLAISGEDIDWRRAMDLLEHADDEGLGSDNQTDNRVRAALISREGRSRAERAKNLTEARRIMTGQVEQAGESAAPLDRLLLAKVCEQEAWLVEDLSLLQAAREQLQAVLNRPGAGLSDIRTYADFLSRQLTRAGAEETPGWPAVRSVFLDDAARLAQDCGRKIAEIPADDEREAALVEMLQLVGCQVRLFAVAGQSQAAADAVAAFRQDRIPTFETAMGKPRAWFSIASLYSLVGDHVQAEEWYRRLVGVSPEAYLLLAAELAAQGRTADAIDACLAAAPRGGELPPAVATSLAKLMTTPGADQSSIERSDPLIRRSLQAHPENVELLVAAAVFNVTRNDSQEAIQQFRRALELAPAHALALNNLATLLAEQPGQEAEALRLIKQAMTTLGRQPALLDTLGTIEMRSGRPAAAIECLEEAVADGGGDARWYFHLAAAYHSAQNYERAQDALADALRRGLEQQILTEGDQRLLRELKQRLAPGAAERSLESREPETPGTATRAGMTRPARKAA